MKRFFLLAVFIFFSPAFADSTFLNEQNYAEYTLENGMELFVLEDFSSALVRLDLSFHAGFSAQNASNTGFFPLYTRLFKYAKEDNPLLQKLTSECNADSARYTISISEKLVPEVFSLLSKRAFEPVFTEKNIKREYSALKNEIMQYAPTPVAFINTAIDSRIFSDEPWKKDSGIYPQIFIKSTPAEIRTDLTKISKAWYTPKNAALFVSGSIKKEDVFSFAEKYFGTYKNSSSFEIPKEVKPSGKIRKFIMHDLTFSDEMTQIVLEYTSLPFETASLFASTFNEDSSSLKKNLCASSLLNIRGPEYINASVVQQNGCSRLIFQTLLEQNRRSPVEQSEMFIEMVKNAPKNTNAQEYKNAEKTIQENFKSVTLNSTNFMKSLSDFWAIAPFIPENKNEKRLLAQKLLFQPERIKNQNENDLNKSLENETPFIFVLVNTKNFNKYQKDYKRLGYEEINSKNSSWYTQELYKNALKQLSEERLEKQQQKEELKDKQNLFLQKNRSSIKKIELSNGIPVTVKTNRLTENVSLLICIDGGKLADKNNPGFQNAMINALSLNIQKEIKNYKDLQMIKGLPTVQAETYFSESHICVECLKEDLSLCITAVSNALIFGEITPAEADSAVYSVQTKKRLNDANPINQMTFRSMKYFYDSIFIRNIFNSEKDILQKTSYNDILASYPKFLDASLYSIFIAGNTDAQAVSFILQDSLGILTKQTERNAKEKKEEVPEPDFPEKPRKISLKIRHLFYTDIKAEDAGPMPAVLVPTKNFADPVQYWFKIPKIDSEDFVLFNALLYRFSENLNTNSVDTKLFTPTNEFHCAGLSFLNVEHTTYIEEIYKKTLKEFNQKLSEQDSFEMEQTKNAWVLNKLSETENNSGTAKLIALSSNNKINYLDEYEILLKSKSKDFLRVLNDYFLQEPLLQIFSSDAKK